MKKPGRQDSPEPRKQDTAPGSIITGDELKKRFARKTLEEILIGEGYIPREQVEEVAKQFKGNPSRMGEFLVKEELVTNEQLAQAQAIQFGLEDIDLSTFEIDDTLFI